MAPAGSKGLIATSGISISQNKMIVYIIAASRFYRWKWLLVLLSKLLMAPAGSKGLIATSGISIFPNKMIG
jgi:hypothetical protein